MSASDERMDEIGWRLAQLQADHQKLEAAIKKAIEPQTYWLWALDHQQREAHLFLYNRGAVNYGFVAVCGSAMGTVRHGSPGERWTMDRNVPTDFESCVTCLEGLVYLQR